ncbi:MAG: hypothetical protein LQ352_005822, partial [Teloschistes flavicans]
MPDLSILGTLAPYHILTYVTSRPPIPVRSLIFSPQLHSYGTLLGSAVFQSFIGGVVAFRSLPRPQFASLQSAIFPIYFSLQTALPVLLALTYPASTRSLLGSATQQAASGLNDFFEAGNRWSVLAPIGT